MQMKKLTTLACAAAFATLSGAASAQISGNTVKIAVLTDMSGTYSAVAGPGAVLATQMAIDDFIAEAKPAFKVEMVSADHQNKADIASNRARQWFERDGVDTVTELVTTSTALAVMKIAKEMDRIALMSGPASTPITNEQCNDRTVHYTYDTYSLANGTAKAVTQQGGKNWFFLTADYAFGQSLDMDSSAVVGANGGKVLGSSGAQIIGLANAGADTTNAIKQAAEFGITPKQQLAGLLMFISDVHSLGLQNAQTMYLTTGFYWDFDDDTRAWSKRFFDKHKKMPTMVQAGQYSSVLHYLRAVNAVGSDDAGKVMEQMKKTPINDFFAKNGRIREDGRMVHDMYLAQVKTPDESKGPWDYYHIRATIPAEEAFLPLSESVCPLVKK